MQLCKETQLVAIPYVCVVLIARPEEAVITLVSSIEAVTDVGTEHVLPLLQDAGHVVCSELDRAVVVGPTRVKLVAIRRRGVAIANEIEMAEAAGEHNGTGWFAF